MMVRLPQCAGRLRLRPALRSSLAASARLAASSARTFASSSSSSSGSNSGGDSGGGSSSSGTRVNPTVTAVAQLAGGIGGIYLAVQFVQFVNDKFVDPSGAAVRQGRAPSAAEAESPSPWFIMPTMNPSLDENTLSAIFSSVITPLLEFDREAEEFIDRKDVIIKRMEAQALRRRTQAVPAKEVKELERLWTAIQAEERTVFAPRLEVLAELYWRRSRELMQRTQILAERRFAAGQKVLQAATPAEKAAAQAEADTSRRQSDLEMQAFQKLASSNQNLLDTVMKYGLKGADDLTLRRHMMPGQQAPQTSPPAK